MRAPRCESGTRRDPDPGRRRPSLVLIAFAMFVVDYGVHVGRAAARRRTRRTPARWPAPWRWRSTTSPTATATGPAKRRRCSRRAGQQRVGRGAGRRCERRDASIDGRRVPGMCTDDDCIRVDVYRNRRAATRCRCSSAAGRPDRAGRARDRHGAGGHRQRQRLSEAVGSPRQMDRQPRRRRRHRHRLDDRRQFETTSTSGPQQRAADCHTPPTST